MNRFKVWQNTDNKTSIVHKEINTIKDTSFSPQALWRGTLSTRLYLLKLLAY